MHMNEFNSVNAESDVETPEDLMQILPLIGPGLEVAELNIREFKNTWHVKPLSDPLRINQSAISAYCAPAVEYTINQITAEQNRAMDDNDKHHVGGVIYSNLQEKLIDPKVKTGRITQLAIAEVLSNDLPRTMVKKFTNFNHRPRIKQDYIEGYDSYYKVFGKIRAGSLLASIACGICVSPYIDSGRINTHTATSRYPFLRFRVQAEKYKQNGLAEDAASWDNLVRSSRNREAYARNNPLNGGLASPR